MGSIKVFLSSSKVLRTDRIEFENSLNRENTLLTKRGTTILELILWERFDDIMTLESSQEEYNKKVRSCDLFVLIYSLKVGKYTLQEFKNARLQFEARGKPGILIYYKKEDVLNQEWSKEDRDSMDEFNTLMATYGYFTKSYNTVDELWEHFRWQVETIINPPGPKIKNHNVNGRPYGKNFVGRRDYIQQILKALSIKPCVSIEGFSGIGKTSVAMEIAHIFLGNSVIKNTESFEFNYIVWVTCKTAPNNTWFNDVLDKIAEVLKHDNITQIAPDNVSAKIKDVEDLLRSESKRILLIIDNYESVHEEDLEKWLTTLPEPNKVLITSQTEFSDAYTINLKSMKEDEAKDLLLAFADERGIDRIKQKPEHQLLSLVKITGGNPQAIKMAVGYINGGQLRLEQVVENLKADNPTGKMEFIFKKLHEVSWADIGEDAQKVLLSTPLFVGVNAIDTNALKAASGLSAEAYELAIQTLVKWKLLEISYDENNPDDDNRYIIHPTTRGFAINKLLEQREFEYEARKRWYRYYIEYISKRIRRQQPNEPYWDVLVDERMELIDLEWPSINEVLNWVCNSTLAEKDEVILDMVMLLTHYMDSRFYNHERLKYVHQAVKAAQTLGRRYEEALLRIDALGWTFVEENKFGRAVDEIMTGITIAKRLIDETGKGHELLALGYSWCARAYMEEGIKTNEALELLEQARSYEENSKSWILFRILMASGDIYLKQGEKERALIHYRQAREKMKDYNGEGNYYQINPRIGLAYVALDQLHDAEEIFKELANQQKISIGKLYGQYGVALVKFKKKNNEEAKSLYNKIKDELTRRKSSNLLMNLIAESEKSLHVEFNPLSMIPDRKNFDGKAYEHNTDLFTIKNKQQMIAAVTNYGARIVSLLVYDKNKQVRDIIIGPGSLHQFMSASERYFGATIGRYANRIANGKFSINNNEYNTGRNEKGKTTFHGGFRGFDSVIWNMRQLNDSAIQLNYTAEDGEEGFPGKLEVEVTMSLTDNNELQINYRAWCDKQTIVSLTNHAFFNLNGQEATKITDHRLQINAHHYTPVNADLIPSGNLQEVNDTPFDFRQTEQIGSRIDMYHPQMTHALGYDHNFVLYKLQSTQPQLAAKVYSPESGIQMEIYTTEPCLHLYSGNGMKGYHTLKSGKTDDFRTAFVLEPQQFPDSPNQHNFPSAIIQPGQVFTSTTLYRFYNT